MNRRVLIAGAAATAVTKEEARMHVRKIPKSGEEIPVVGLGTWQTFDVGMAESDRAPLREVLRRFFAAGARVIDSSPMYGRSESVVGDLVSNEKAFLATKVWTSGRSEGEKQMAESIRRMKRVDLMQVHNLVDWRTHLPVMREMKSAGKIRYVGITHYQASAFAEMEKLVREEKLDFVQLPYSAAFTDAEKTLLPAAQESGTAVLVMRPFEGGALLSRLKGKEMPGFAKELGAETWAELLIKFVVSHPAVTAAIPATSKPDHLSSNVRAGTGALPDTKQRKAIVEAIR